MEKNTLKSNVLKKCLGKKYIILDEEGYYIAEITKVIDHENVLAKDKDGQINQVSIFNIRNPNQEI